MENILVSKLVDVAKKKGFTLYTREKNITFDEKFLNLTIAQLLKKIKEENWEIFLTKEVVQKPTGNNGNITFHEPSIAMIPISDFLKDLNKK